MDALERSSPFASSGDLAIVDLDTVRDSSGNKRVVLEGGNKPTGGTLVRDSARAPSAKRSLSQRLDEDVAPAFRRSTLFSGGTLGRISTTELDHGEANKIQIWLWEHRFAIFLCSLMLELCVASLMLWFVAERLSDLPTYKCSYEGTNHTTSVGQ